MPARAVVVAALLVLAAGCADSGETSRGPVELAEEARLIAPDTIEVAVMSCHGDPEVTALSQDRRTVEVEITSTVSNPGDACLDTFTVVLDAPLEERELVDATSGRTLIVTSPAG